MEQNSTQALLCQSVGVIGKKTVQMRIRDSIRWNAESLTEASEEVGDAHSSDMKDERDNITLSEPRGVSLKTTVTKTR